jgi:hypothetical protein
MSSDSLLAAYNWTVARLLVAILLTVLLLGGIGFVGLVGYAAYQAGRPVAAQEARDRAFVEKNGRVSDEEFFNPSTSRPSPSSSRR